MAYYTNNLRFADPRIFAGLNYRQGESWPYPIRFEDADENPVDVTGWTFSAPLEYYDSDAGGSTVELREQITDASHAPLQVIGTPEQMREGFVQMIIPSDLWMDAIPLNTDRPPIATIWVSAAQPRDGAASPFVRKIGIGIAIRRAI